MFSHLINLIKLSTSYFFSVIFRKPIHWGMPLGISVEPTNRCNLKCRECPTGMDTLTRKKEEINIELYKKTIDELAKHINCIIFYFQGEPFLNANLPELISYASLNKIYSITSTNGHFLTQKNAANIIESGLNKLIISIDGTTQKVYEKYRINGSLSKVIEGTKTIIKKKQQLASKLPKIIFQFLVTADNETQVHDAKTLAKQLKVNSITFKSAQIYDFKNGHPLIPKNEKYSRYKKQKDGTYTIQSKLKNRCWRMWSQPVITANGDVVPCCFDKDAKYKMGNLNEKSFIKIWNSQEYDEFRKKVFTNRKNIDICSNCTEGLFRINIKV